ncbi:MAG TPA: HAMP domain-containing sensor histidine kinase, partial [Chitinophagales bacterium]|nr:HAMP domain-containing sensor histidine kinase [Chitinophagales bacterium]
VDITLKCPIHACFVFGDKDQLLRVFTNIIKNATQAIPEDIDGQIHIDVLDEARHYCIVIKDNGIGIPTEKHAHIFEPNFTTKSSGTGLGLAISKNIIERMNGSITFESVVNEYSIFYIKIPKHQ